MAPADTHTSDELSDAEVMASLARGTLEALSVVYLRYGKLVSSVIARYTHPAPKADVDDLTQEVFLAVASSAKTYRDSGNFRGFLIGIAVRKARESRRRGWLRRNLFDRFGPKASSDGFVESAKAVDARLEVEAALASLDEGQREVMLLSLVEGLSGAEVAAALGIEEKTVWTRLHRARTKLKANQASDGEPTRDAPTKEQVP